MKLLALLALLIALAQVPEIPVENPNCVLEGWNERGLYLSYSPVPPSSEFDHWYVGGTITNLDLNNTAGFWGNTYYWTVYGDPPRVYFSALSNYSPWSWRLDHLVCGPVWDGMIPNTVEVPGAPWYRDFAFTRLYLPIQRR